MNSQRTFVYFYLTILKLTPFCCEWRTNEKSTCLCIMWVICKWRYNSSLCHKVFILLVILSLNGLKYRELLPTDETVNTKIKANHKTTLFLQLGWFGSQLKSNALSLFSNRSTIHSKNNCRERTTLVWLTLWYIQTFLRYIFYRSICWCLLSERGFK